MVISLSGHVYKTYRYRMYWNVCSGSFLKKKAHKTDTGDCAAQRCRGLFSPKAALPYLVLLGLRQIAGREPEKGRLAWGSRELGQGP